jgi:thiosulfate/3-mercaptopyruvate sulfurtransferase
MARKVTLLATLCIFILTTAAAAGAAGWTNPDLLMTAKDVKSKLGNSDWVILDARNLDDYAKGHIPGAISLGKQAKKALRDSTSRIFSDVSKYEKLFGKIGIGNDSHVVVYGEHSVTDTMKDTSVAFWILEYLGHDKVHVLNGGLDGWVNAGYSLTPEPTILPEKTFKAKVVASRLATTDEIVGIATGKTAGVQLIDARTSKEHKGKQIRALRGGNIPNTTMNVSHKDTFDESKDPASGEMVDNGFLSYDRVASFYKDLDPNKRAIGYCQTGTRSTLTYLELRLLGFKDPANYDDSWRVYASDHRSYPVANEQWFDFNKVRKLDKKMKELEEKLAELTEEEAE